jgi:hypothetical protein
VEYAVERLRDDVAGVIDVSGARGRCSSLRDWGGVIAWLPAPHAAAVAAGRRLPHPMLRRALRRGVRQWLRSWYMLFFQLPWPPE